MPKTLIRPIYQNLLNEISDIYSQSKLQARQELNRILTKAYWEIGKRIVTVEQDNELRAQYGDGLLKRLSADLTEQHGEGFSLTNLKYIRKFYITHRKGQPVDLLSWAKHCVLLSIQDDNVRKRYQDLTLKENWSRAQLVKALKEDYLITTPDIPIVKAIQKVRLVPQKGALYTYKIETVEPGWAHIDCGFNITRKIPLKGREKLATGDIVTCVKEKSLYKLTKAYSGLVSRASDPEQQASSHGSLVTSDALYTYRARVLRIIDGDTLWAKIDCGFDTFVKQKLRLRGIDAPELKTAEGKKAKEFVEKALGVSVPVSRVSSHGSQATSNKNSGSIIIYTTKPDKFDRYLADVYYGKDQAFLNQELLNNQLAIGYEE